MALNVLCDNQHEHAPWAMTNGVFDTSLEAEYTPMLAKALATAILEAVAKEYKLTNAVQFSKRLKLSHFHAIAAAKQPSKAISMQTVPDFAFIVVVANLPATISFPLNGSELSRCVSVATPQMQLFLPCLSKVLRRTSKKGGESRPLKLTMDKTPSLQSLADVDGIQNCSNGLDRNACLVCRKVEKTCEKFCIKVEKDVTTEECVDWVFGVRWTPELFLLQAVEAGHPFSNFSGLQSEVRKACECVATQSPVEVINNRCSKLGEWLKLSKSLQNDEERLKASMTVERRGILKTKRILLMRHIIETEGYEDKELANDLESGFSLVGEVPTSNVLPKKLLTASISTDDLLENSQRANTALRYMTRGSGDAELDNKLWEKTMTEVDKGWMKGPLPWSALTSSSTVSRRFPLEQSGKVRPIDDLSQSQINSTVTTYEQATVDGPDVICAMAIYMMRCLGDASRATAIVGRSLDLASAYRQLAIADESLCHAFLSVYDPAKKEAALFQQVALPFGSRTAVNAFIRCARFLQWVAAKCLKLPVSCYFDDFVSFTYKALANNTQSSLCLMLDILGWAFDREGPKSDDFSELVCALGVQFDLSSCGDGTLKVCNTERRIRETVQLLDATMAEGVLQKKGALVLRGRLAFCDAFIFGRLGKIALQNITRHAYASPYNPEISNVLRDSLKLLKERVLTGRPRTLSCKLLQTMYLFTDASFDEDKGSGLGAVLVDGTGKIVAWFSLEVGLQDISLFLEPGRQTAIGELETLTVAMALLIWGSELQSVQLMIYIDNEGSKYSLIKGYSVSLAITSICALASTCLDENYILPWFSRVPSPSNVADYPSRGWGHPLLRRETKVPEGEVRSAFQDSLKFVGEANLPHLTWVGSVAKAAA
eukprot:s3819_g6.t1